MIFDSHAHYYSSAFEEDRDELLLRMHEKQDVTAIVCPAENAETSYACVELAGKYDFIFAAVGVHPCCADTWNGECAGIVRELLRERKTVALGEIGLDYYRRNDNKEVQKRAFAEQLELAEAEKMPVIIHDREAHGDMYDILRHYRPEGVMHCFSGSVESAREALHLGLYIGLGGSVTAANAIKPLEVAKYVPLDRLVLETDAPYLIPRPYRTGEGKYKRSESWMIRYVAAFIAELRGTDPDELLAVTAKNAAELYRVPI